MSTAEKIRILEGFKEKYMAINHCTDQVIKLFGSDLSGNFFNSQYAFTDYTIQIIANLIGDKSDWLMWYIFDNDWGNAEYEAGYNGDLRKIKSFEDLLWLIDHK